MKREFWILFTIMVTEVLGFSLILPFLPIFAQSLGASPLVIGLIFATFSVFQLFSAPIMGRLSDYYGRRPLLILSQFSTFIGFVVLGFANTVFLIFVSRIIDGLLGSNFTISQGYLSDISTKKDRSKVFGLSGAAFGFGFLIGPGIGGYLAQFSYSLPAFLAAGISLVTILMTWFWLPETVKRKKKMPKIKFFEFAQFKSYFKNKKISSKLWPYALYLLSHMIFISMLALYAQRQIGLDTVAIGFSLTYIGLTSIIMRGVLLSKLIDLFGEKTLQYSSIISIIIGMLIFSSATNWSVFLIATTFMSIGSGIIRPIMTGNISRQVSRKEQGALMGLTNSLGSVTQITGPLMGGFMLNYFFPGSMPLLAAFLMMISFVLVLKNKNNY